jgi:hypothetical protein
MFPTPETRSTTAKHRLRSLLQTAVVFATLSEPAAAGEPAVSHPHRHELRHPHRRPVAAQPRRRRPGSLPARPQVCTSPVPEGPSAR